MGSYGSLAVDLGMLAIVIVSGLLAYARGFAREAVTLGALAAAAAATLFLFPIALPLARQVIGSEEIAAGATIALLFIAVLVAVLLLGPPIAARIGGSDAGSVDRWLGLGFGVARGALIIVLLYMLLAFAVPGGELPRVVRAAQLTPLVENAAEWLLSLVPPRLREDVVLSAASAVPAVRSPVFA
ncbi:MAG: CvpA family protein [Proteobacteria bacterium]|nr:CvpA family protein [Pseudomonadota bacterium]